MPEPIEDTDEMILARAVEGDAEAFSMLYERYVGRIYNYIYYRTGTAVDAEDLTAKVFYRALGRISFYRDQGVPFSAWLYRIAHNLVANWYRDNSRKQEVSLEDHVFLHPHADYPEQVLVEDQEKEWLLKTIRKLPQERQELLILKFVDRLSNSEIALIMGRSEGAIKSLYHRTLLALRDELEKKE
ncbi:MAG: sigma-70 family RNA polymerase sigma factor [Anaerolineae bacterium]|nr:sigma-70 family RNA polymerase sigma factor [Anaerolineae bacterium]